MAICTYFTRTYDKHARYCSTKTPTSQGYNSAINVSDQTKEELLQLMLQLLSNQKEVAEAATAGKEHLQTMSNSNGELLGIIKRLNNQNQKLTEQNLKLTNQVTSLTDALAKAKSARGGERGGGRGGGGHRDGGRNNNNSSGNSNSSRLKCGICSKKEHAEEDCFELEKNKDDRPDNWKSIFE